jgi:hypothetical protein
MLTLGIIASSHKFEASRVTINLTIAADTNNYNIQSNRGGTYDAGNTDVTLTINSGVAVGSTSTGTYALETGSSWATGDTITIVNNGTVKGCGGSGGAGGDAEYDVNVDDGENGGDGGNAFRAQFACTFTNNGSVYGGGGGGGGGGSNYRTAVDKAGLTTRTVNAGNGGGGGAGILGGGGGAGGTALPDPPPLFYTVTQGVDGDDGTATAGGAGGSDLGSGGEGGNGGGLGADGVNGIAGSTGGSALPADASAGGSGGIRGFYQVGSSLINSGSGIGGVVGGRTS